MLGFNFVVRAVSISIVFYANSSAYVFVYHRTKICYICILVERLIDLSDFKLRIDLIKNNSLMNHHLGIHYKLIGHVAPPRCRPHLVLLNCDLI